MSARTFPTSALGAQLRSAAMRGLLTTAALGVALGSLLMACGDDAATSSPSTTPATFGVETATTAPAASSSSSSTTATSLAGPKPIVQKGSWLDNVGPSGGTVEVVLVNGTTVAKVSRTDRMLFAESCDAAKAATTAGEFAGFGFLCKS